MTALSTATPPIPRRTVLCLGLAQLVAWGVSYYLIGVFGDRIAAELGWNRPIVYGGFSAALVVMGMASPAVGRATERRGGRPVMIAGTILTALGCVGLSLSRHPVHYYAAWLCLGLAMRMTLYDAAFAALARLGGPQARRPISQITLLGGLASTTFWPIGHALADQFGWRGALLAYAGFAVAAIPLLLAIPGGRYREPAGSAEGAAGSSARLRSRRHRLLAGALYALIVTVTAFLNTGMAAHMIGVLAGLGLGATLAVWISTLRGIGQSFARLCEVLFGGRLHPLSLAVLATALLPLCFVSGLFSGATALAGIAFAFLYGAGNGLVTIVRGTLPLVLFDYRAYGGLVGWLLAPSFLLSALAPLAYAVLIERLGEAAALHASIVLAGIALAAALVLRLMFGPARRP